MSLHIDVSEFPSSEIHFRTQGKMDCSLREWGQPLGIAAEWAAQREAPQVLSLVASPYLMAFGGFEFGTKEGSTETGQPVGLQSSSRNLLCKRVWEIMVMFPILSHFLLNLSFFLVLSSGVILSVFDIMGIV